jgi:ATP-binding cassette subfamily C protein
MLEGLVLAATRRVRTPTVLQMEAVECGAAALGMILGYYGRFVPLAELRRECGVSRDGSKASKIVAAARRYGLLAKGFTKNAETVRQLKPPFIIFWQFNHFVVVERITDRGVFLNDPAIGHRRVNPSEFDAGFTGVVLAMEPGPEFQKGGRPPRIWPGIRQRLRGQTGALTFCLCAGLLLVLPGLALPTIAAVFLDHVIVQGMTSWLRPLLVAIAVAALLQVGLKLLQAVYLRRLRLALLARLSSQFFWHLLRLPMSFYAQRYPGEISFRSKLNARVASILSGQLAASCIDLLTMLFYAAVMFYYDRMLTLIGLACAVVNYAALRWVAQSRIETNLRVAQETGKAAGVAIAGLQSLETLKSSGQETGFFTKWAGYYAKAHNAHQELELANVKLGLVPSVLAQLSQLLILLIGGLRVMNGELSIGMLVALQSLMSSFLAPVAALVSLGTTLQELHGDVLRLDDVLDNVTPQDLSTSKSLAPTGNGQEPLRLEGTLQIARVTFGYSPSDPPLIQDFELRVSPGQRVALVGGSGSGKSTVSKLITGLYEPWQGEVLFDGRPRAGLPRTLVNQSLSFVDQEIMLFEGTIRDNLTLWDATVPETVLIQACKDAAIYNEVAALPGGFDAPLQEGGTNLSGGQRQRLEIARALVSNPSLVVLDEATSALDAESERIIDDNLRRRGCTCILVAHRLSTIRDCDEILVLDKGKVVERGTHEQLWAAGGCYAQLIQTEEG